jgi:tetratricopeptide (TPR) repeat protein
LIQQGNLHEGIDEFNKTIEINPQSVQGFLELAKVHVAKQNLAAAKTLLRDAPRAPETSIALGDVLDALGDLFAAEEEYRRGLELDRRSGPLYMRLAALLLKQKRRAEAELVYRNWIDVRSTDVLPHVALAQFYRSTGKLAEALDAYRRARQVDSSSGLAHEALISAYLEAGQLKDATVEIDTLLKEHPQNVGGQLLKARVQIEEGKGEQALSLLAAIAHQEPRSAAAHHYLGIAWARMNNLDKALSALKEAQALEPDSSEIRTSLAQVYLAEGSLFHAIEQAEEAVRLSPHNVSAVRVLAEAHLRAGNLQQARQRLEEAVAAYPRDPFIHHALGLTSRRLHQNAVALAHFEQALEADPRLIEALDQIVGILLSQSHAAKARQRVRRQLETVSDDPRLYNLLGRVSVYSHDYVEGEAAFKKAMTLNDTLLATYAHLGDLYVRQGKVDHAVKEFETILSKNPQHVPTLTLLGMLHDRQQEFDRAVLRYEEALRLNPGFAPAANNLAWLLVERGGNTDRALSYAEKAREVLPRDPHIADTLGWIYFHKHMYAKSVSLLKEALNQLPEQPAVLYHYGMAQYENNNKTEAKHSLAKFVALSPDDPQATRAKQILAELS